MRKQNDTSTFQGINKNNLFPLLRFLLLVLMLFNINYIIKKKEHKYIYLVFMCIYKFQIMRTLF